ncbi:glycosyltransferase family 4 protein [Rhodoligotrophos appendicifer]|uniref:glycosyltransferase family 4 protein n=1 Tax=Rhodoligotrophos appendicifer TaxID=987056 RepID=UPI0014783AE0
MEVVAWDLARALSDRGHEVEILTTSCEKLPPRSIQEGVSIHAMDVPPGRYTGEFWRKTTHLFGTEYKMRTDLVLGIGAGAYAIARNRERGDWPPILMQSHGQAWGEMVSKLLIPSPTSWLKASKNAYGVLVDRVLRRFDRVIAVGPAVENVLKSRPTKWMLGSTPVSVISNGINETLFAFNLSARKEIRRSLSIGDQDQVIISASRLHIQKGLHQALEGFARAKSSVSSLRFIIAGSGPAESQLKEHAQSLGVSRDVIFCGEVSRGRLASLLSAADLFLFTSTRREGLALGPLEAAAAGLPCVLSEHLSVPALSSAAVNPQDFDAIAQAILVKLFSTEPFRKSILPPMYSLQLVTDQYEKVLREHIVV